MRKPDFYRYFLALRPDLELRRRFAAIGDRAGQRVRTELLHLTLCVIAEAGERDPFLLPRVQSALAGPSLSSFPVRLGRVAGDRQGGMVKALGHQRDIQAFYRALLALLARRDMAPLHRRSGLRAHVTLGHEPCAFDPFTAPLEWFPTELLLIESEVGLSRHNVLARMSAFNHHGHSGPSHLDVSADCLGHIHCPRTYPGSSVQPPVLSLDFGSPSSSPSSRQHPRSLGGELVRYRSSLRDRWGQSR